MIAGYFGMHHQFDNFKGRTYFHPCKHVWLQIKKFLVLSSSLGHENRQALEPENSAQSKHYLFGGLILMLWHREVHINPWKKTQ